MPLNSADNNNDIERKIQDKMELIDQGKCLCSQYIRARLRRAGILNRKVLQRLRSSNFDQSVNILTLDPSLSAAYNSIGEELERMHPRVYNNVTRQLSRTPFGELEDCETAPMLLNLVAKDLLKNNITWGKIVSLFAICGGFAIDCVRQGHYDFIQYLVEGIAEILDDDELINWLNENDGWFGIQKHIKPTTRKFSFLGWLTIFVMFNIFVYFVSNIFRQAGCHFYSVFF